MKLDYIKCGDSAELMGEIPDESISLTVTSPPYDDLRTYDGYTFDFKRIAQELFRVTVRGGWLCGLSMTQRLKEVSLERHLGKPFISRTLASTCTIR